MELTRDAVAVEKALQLPLTVLTLHISRYETGPSDHFIAEIINTSPEQAEAKGTGECLARSWAYPVSVALQETDLICHALKEYGEGQNAVAFVELAREHEQEQEDE